MAKHSFAEEMLTDLDNPIDDLKDLNAEERQALNEWAQFFWREIQNSFDVWIQNVYQYRLEEWCLSAWSDLQ